MKTTILVAMTMMVMACGKSQGGDTQRVNVQTDYTDTSSKTEIACPSQTANTAVLFAFGQSNSANSDEHLYSNSDARIINYFEGHCYVASDPMLGATSFDGSVWIPMAQQLIATGNYDNIILITAGYGGSAIQDWVTNGILSPRYAERLLDATSHYQITGFLWHQGESNVGTNPSDYTSWLNQVINQAFTVAPSAKFYVSVATFCQGRSDANIENAQRSIVNGTNILAGPDTDADVPMSMRRSTDHCHLNQLGQETAATLWFNALTGI